nr:CpaF family protein [Sneathiella glossodoripedis]
MSLWRSSSNSQKNAKPAQGRAGSSANDVALVDRLYEQACSELLSQFEAGVARPQVSAAVKQFAKQQIETENLSLNVLEQRNLVAALSDRIWSEYQARNPAVDQNAIGNVEAGNSSQDSNGVELPSATQIVEEGVTVFGVDAEAPVEVKAEFERPETEFLSSKGDFEEEEDFSQPQVPLANAAPIEDQASAVENPEAAGDIVPPVEEEEKSADILKLEPVLESQAPRATSQIEKIKERIQPLLLERIDISAAVQMDRLDLARDISDIVADILVEERIQLNQREQRELIERLMHDMLGLGPLEPLLADETITDIMVNGPKQVYVEQKGKLVLSDCQFRDNAHVLSIAGRIVSHVGRRVDESNPLVDARLADGSRVNIIIPPLAIDGPSISIRKFAKQKITLDTMEKQGNLSPAAATVLRVAGRCRLNILISGGTGSGKTTMLNAISQLIDPGERIVTIEDAAELQLQQPHVVRLETRSANLEGTGEISMRDLLKNSLRMRPDRIILGEIRGSEAIDMLQAMNTGHDGSLSTIHANRPREALTRLENMVGMSGINLPAKAVRTQIASAIDLIVQVSRMRDGVRRVTYVSEVVGMEEDVITMQDLFWYEYQGEDKGGRLIGDFKSSGLRPHFTPRAAYFGLDKMLIGAM